jgi:hypothetical protein
LKRPVKIGSHFYDSDSDFLLLKYEESSDYINDLASLKSFPNLTAVNFGGSDLNDWGLNYVTDCPYLESLNLQETEITDKGIKSLQKLDYLMHLRLKGNPQLTDTCVPDLLKLRFLQSLHIQETSITQNGLEMLIELKLLQEIVIDVWKNNYTFEGLHNLSAAIPDCHILAKGAGTFRNGEFEGKWKD